MKRALTLTFAAVAVLLAGCSQNAPSVRVEPTYDAAGKAPLVQSSRDAIGRLTSSLDTTITGPGPVLVATLVNVNDLTRSAPIGRTLSEQYATAMASIGYNVKEVKLRGAMFIEEGTGELLLSREIQDIAREHNAALVLVGTFSPAAEFTYISLKLVRTEDSRIIRGHDYALPNDRDVRRLLVTTPR